MTYTKKQRKSSRKAMDNRSNNRNKLSVLIYRADIKEKAKTIVKQQAMQRNQGRNS